MGYHSAHRPLRFLILIGILAVSGFTLWSFLARQRRRSLPQSLPAKIASGIDQQTQAFSLSKSFGGQSLYTVHASEVTNFKDTGKTILHNVSIELFGKKGNRRDRITTEECELDQAKSSFFLPGEVTIEMEPPQADPSSPLLKQAPSGPVHIVTSGLTFDQNTGVAATEKEVRFQFAGVQGKSQGAIYNPKDQTITLKAAVEFDIWPPQANGTDSAPQESKLDSAAKPGQTERVTHIRAGSLRFPRDESKIFLTAPVEITQGSRSLQAGDSEIVLDEQQRAQHASLGGGVHGIDHNPLEPSELRASRSELEFTEQGKVRKILLEGGASWATSSAQSRKEGQSQSAELFFQEPDGLLTRVRAEGRVRVEIDPTQAAGNFPLPREEPAQHDPVNGSRILTSQQADMILAPDGETLREVRTQSSSTLQIFPAEPGEDRRTVQGENFIMEFNPDGDLSRFSADKNVTFAAESTGKAPRKRISTSDHLSATFDSSTHSVGQMRQWGQFHYQDPDRQASAEQADYTAAGDVVVLQGEPVVWNPSGKLSGKKMTLVSSTNEITAEGKVATTDFPAASPGNPAPDPIHVVAEHLQYNSKSGKAQYEGHARLWQGSDLIEADWLELDREQKQLLAKNGVYSVFPGRSDSESGKTNSSSPSAKAIAASPGRDQASRSPGPQAAPGIPPEMVSGPFEIRSEELLYKEEEHRAHYHGKVEMRNSSSAVTGDELEIIFKPQDTESHTVPGSGSGQIERAIATGNVVIIQPGRKSTGTRAEYIPGENKVILTGNLASVVDAQKGTTQGARLTYFTGDDRIFVQGEPGSPAETRRPVKR